VKIAAVSVVKDECDIIELFIRLNAPFLDHHYIVDDGSSDTTVQILNLLKAEGYPLSIRSDFAPEQRQRFQSTEAIKEAIKTRYYDWWINLDADEFILGDRATLEGDLAKTPSEHCASIRWQTYVPFHDGTDWNLHRDFKPRVSEPHPGTKVIIPGKAAPHIMQVSGHHYVQVNGHSIHQTDVSLRLAHVPVRSSAQLVSKAIIGSHKLSLVPDRKPFEGFHWDRMADEARQSGYRLTLEQLQAMAYSYSLPSRIPVVHECFETPRIGSEEVLVRYKELTSIPLLRRFDAYAKLLCSELSKVKNNVPPVPQDAGTRSPR
jgi:hypothetical protein